MEQENSFESRKFEQIRMEKEILEGYKFVDCEFEDCVFEECTIVSCSFVECRFQNCRVISLRAKYSQMKYSEFEKCSLIGVHWQELAASKSIAEPIRSFKDCLLKYNSFVEMSLKKFDFSGNVILETLFDRCKLAESRFNGCRLLQTQFLNCDLQKADFREAVDYLIDIMTCKVKGARFSFPEVVNLLKVLEIKVD